MSTFLELCQKLKSESGLSGTGPANVAGQTGMDKRLVEWVRDAHEEICGERAWPFLWRRVSKTLNPAQVEVDPAVDWALADMGKVVRDQVWLTSVSPKAKVVWEEFYTVEQALADAPAARPSRFSRRPDDKLVFYPAADQAYTVRLDYFVDQFALADNTSVPLLPDGFHDMLVWKALQYYGFHNGDPEALQRGQVQYGILHAQLLQKYGLLPTIENRPLDEELVTPSNVLA